MLRRIFELFQLDRTLVYALLARIWQAITGPVTIALVIKSMDEDETGVYSILIGVLGIQTLFELGLLNVLIGHAGHASKALEESAGEPSSASAESARARMAELIHASKVWFGAASILFAIASISLGWYTLARSDTQIAWTTPLLTLIPIVALTIYVSPLLAILEGSGDRELVYGFAFFARVIGTCVVWTTLIMGFGIWALIASALIQTVCSAYVPFVCRASFFRRFRNAGGVSKDSARVDSGTEFSWMKDVVPAQWRMAAVSAAYHFATQYFVIILANYSTTAEAGRLGLTLMITAAIQMFALAWVQTKFSVISQMHAQGDRESAGTLWRHTAVVSTLLLIVAFTALTIIIWYLPDIQAMLESWGFKKRDLSARFITPTQCIIYAVACVANHLTSLQGFYVLARKANPLVVAAVTGFLSTALIVWVAGAHYATNGIVIGFAVGMTLVAFPLHTIAYLRYRQHSSIAETSDSKTA